MKQIQQIRLGLALSTAVLLCVLALYIHEAYTIYVNLPEFECSQFSGYDEEDPMSSTSSAVYCIEHKAGRIP